MSSVTARRAKAISLIKAGLIHSQSDLVKHLKKAGFPVTQATASRDLEEIGAVRGRNAAGDSVYRISDTDDESISDWYASSVAKAKNEEHVDKEWKVFFRGNEILSKKPKDIDRWIFWSLTKQFVQQFTIKVPTDILGSLINSFHNFLSYKQYELNGRTPNSPWFNKEQFLNDFNKSVESTRERYHWSTKVFKDEATGYWISPDVNADPNLPQDYVLKFMKTTLNYNWNVYYKTGVVSELVDLGKLSDENIEKYRQLLLNILESIQPDDIQIKKNDPIFNKTIKYHVTLHKGKTPDEYDYLSWYDEMTSEQKQKVLSKLKEEGYTSEKFVMVTPADDDNIEAIKPRFFETVTQAKQYIQKQSYKAMLSGEGYIGSLKIVKTGFNMKKDLNDTVQNFYTKLCGLFGSDKNASMFLLRAGIDGIRYPNNSVSGGKTTGFNYVVFDENSVHIDKKEDRELK